MTPSGAGPLEDAEIAAALAEYRRFSEFLAATPALAKLREEARTRIGPTPRDLLFHEHSVSLYRYRAKRPAREARPMLVVPSLVNRPWIMDLLEDESFVRAMQARGFAVYMLEWGEPNPGQKHLSLDRYVRGYLGRAVKRVLRDSGADSLALAGYCLGGTLALLYTAIDHGRTVSALVSMVSPVDFHDHGLLSWWARKEHFDVDRVVDAYGNVPSEFFASSFPWLVPTGNLRKARTVYEKKDDRDFLLRFLALDVWLTDNVAFPGQCYREVIRHGYQENVLVERREWPLDGGPARLSDVKVPVFAMAAGYDHVAPGASCERIRDLLPTGVPCKTRIVPTGHLGIALGKDLKGTPTPEYWDEIAGFLGR